MLRVAAALGGALLAHAAAASSTPSNAELAEIVAAQQDQIDELRGRASSGTTHLGGYGELHLNLVKDGSDQIDFHRFVLFFGHEFTPALRFRSEVELEHALSGDGKPGEVELEQAYLEFDIAPGHYVRGGVLLLPVGILNETHEPPSFHGVERNRIENRIIPGTWWEGGAGIGGRLGDSGLSYELLLHSGLAVDIDSSNPIRSGRQKVAEAVADDLAATGRIRYQGVPGLDLAASVQYQADISQLANDGVDEAVLLTTHAIFSHGMFGLRALYASWDISGDRPRQLARDRIFGWYVEPGIRLSDQIGLFARYSAHELSADAEETNANIGISYWPHPQVVVKADYEQRDNPDDSQTDSFNLGLGYQF